MKYTFILLFTLGAALILESCKTKKVSVPSDYRKGQLIFGSGGGFTGLATTYILLENGQLFRENGVEGEVVEVGMIEKKVAKEYFKKIKKLKLEEMEHNDPSNMYYFLGKKEREVENRVTWGGEKEINEEFNNLKNELIEMARELEKKE